MADDLLLRLGLALAIGLVVGVERGWRQRDEPDGARTAGVRTFTLFGLLGGVCGALGDATGSFVPWATGFVLLTMIMGAFSYRRAQAEQDYSVTNVVAAMVVFVLGAVAVLGDVQAAAAMGVAATGVLASRQGLHRAIERLTWPELRAALLLLGMTIVVLPILPNRPVDPLGVLNPREIWLLTVLVAAVSYCGYVALKVAGPDRGPPVAGLAGGLASSTATTLAFARRSRLTEDDRGLGSGVALAAMVSLVRASLLAVTLQPSLALLVGVPAGLAAAVFGLGGVLPLLRRRSASAAPAEVGAPFELAGVLGFGVLLAGVTLVGAWVSRTLGAAGSYLFAAISGLVDVDAITLTLARAQPVDGVAPVATAILIALAANGAQKVVFASAFGARSFALRYAKLSALALAVGVAGYLWVFAGLDAAAGGGGERVAGPDDRGGHATSAQWLNNR